ncbi:sigma-70 family RNA polymerase sigma factor [Xanthomonas sp. CFBP 7698]|uniref:sigma-70 family RNA polymerase sigma factor n=1 Tax=Xanthomonas sp. CFBP 7698 TaxID=2082399 RepID=UPI000EC3F273|nr:sigma-70 family RNA polymerase sigma factor [Xanthomonas sp. CFBP 7698]RJS02671.1 hypothetical protein XnspCFBP7698_13800 [Xanthomonas sp. CFBP 7698]
MSDAQLSKQSLPPLFRAALQQGDIERVARHIAEGRSVDSADQRGRTPLMFAAQAGNVQLCKLLLEHGADKAALDGSGMSASDVAKAAGWIAVVELLAPHGDPDVMDLGDPAETDTEADIFGTWEPEDVATIPADDEVVRTGIIEAQSLLEGQRPIPQDAGWGNFVFELPDPDGMDAAIGLQEDDQQALFATLIGRASDYGLYRQRQIDLLVSDSELGADVDFGQHLRQLLGDIGAIPDDERDEWLVGPLIDERLDLEEDPEAYLQYLRDLSATRNDPHFQLTKEVERSVLLDRDGEERLGLLASLVINDAIRTISNDEHAMEALINLEMVIADDPYAAGRISRIEADGDEEGSSKISEKLKGVLALVSSAWANRDTVPSKNISVLVERLELTMYGVRTVHQSMSAAGHANPHLAEILARGTRVEREMFAANIRLAISVAEKYAWSNIPRMDRIQESFIGLLKAIEKFDFRRGYKFSTYATWWLKQAVTRAIADKSRLIRVPVHMMERLSKVAKAARMTGFESPMGIPLSEIANLTGYSEAEVRRTLSVVEDASLWEDSPADQDAVMSVADELADPADFAEHMEMARLVHLSIKEISEKQADVIRHRFGLVDGVERTLEEVGQMHGVTRERIRQIESKALKALRHPQRTLAALEGYVGELFDE